MNTEIEVSTQDGSHRPLVKVTDMWSSSEAFEVGQRMAKALTASNMMPTQYNGPNNISNAMILLEMSQRLKVSPLQLAQEMYIVHNKPQFSSKMLIAGVNACGRFSPMRFKFSDDKTACFAYAKDLETGETLVGSTISLEMAKAEKWGPKWRTLPQQMLIYRSATFWTRVYAPEIALGMITSDEGEDIQPTERKVKSLNSIKKTGGTNAEGAKNIDAD